jgi:hypothetical protein
MLFGNALRRKLRSGSVAFIFVLIYCLVSSNVALAESYYIWGGAGYVSTGGVYYSGNGNYSASSYSWDSYSDETILINARGYNNAGGWHWTGSSQCSDASPGSCTAVTLVDGQTSGSTQRYVTAEHAFIWGWGSEYHYTSSDGAHSSYICYVYAGC